MKGIQQRRKRQVRCPPKATNIKKLKWRRGIRETYMGIILVYVRTVPVVCAPSVMTMLKGVLWYVTVQKIGDNSLIGYNPDSPPPNLSAVALLLPLATRVSTRSYLLNTYFEACNVTYRTWNVSKQCERSVVPKHKLARVRVVAVDLVLFLVLEREKTTHTSKYAMSHTVCTWWLRGTFRNSAREVS